MIGSDALIPAELIAELAKSAKLRPLIHPADAPPERGYTPSRALADFVRCRDLTCRFPGCDKPAVRCDLDHTDPAPRRRPHPRLEPEKPVPPSSFDENVLGLARPTTAGRHHDLDFTRRADLCHHARAAHCCSRVSARPPRHLSQSLVRPRCVGPIRDDAQTSAHPRPEPGQLHCRRAAPQPGSSAVSAANARSLRTTSRHPSRAKPALLLGRDHRSPRSASRC